MDLTTATPVEIDTELGRLYTEAYPHRQMVENAKDSIFNLVRGTEGKELVKPDTYAEAEDRARMLAPKLAQLLAVLDVARRNLAPLAAAEEPLEAEYDSRRW